MRLITTILMLLCSPAFADPESDAVMALVKPADAEFTAVSDGDWSDPATWDNGVPTHGDVYVPSGRLIRFDVDTPPLRSLLVAGTFIATKQLNTSLTVDTLVVTSTGGYFADIEDVFAEDVSVTHRVRFLDDPTLSDNRRLSLGAIFMGHTDLKGRKKIECVRFDPTVTDRLVFLDEPVGWEVGDTLVIAGARHGEHEIRTLESLDGEINLPLEHCHCPPDESLAVHVANFTRNIRFESLAPTSIANRGHTMFMHNPDQHISGVGFYNLGRTDKSKPLHSSDGTFAATNAAGRYFFHLHRNGVQEGVGTAYVGHCAFFADPEVGIGPGWAIAHHSAKARIEHCASFNMFGAHYVAEAGNECGTWESNIAIHTEGQIGSPIAGRINSHKDHAHQGQGYWLSGGGVEMIDCKASGCKFSAVTLVGAPLVESGVQYPTYNLRPEYDYDNPRGYVQPSQVPMKVVRLNAYACGHAIDSWRNRSGVGTSVIEDSSGYNFSRDAIFFSYVSPVDLTNLHLVQGIPPPTEHTHISVSGGGATSNSGSSKIVYINPTIKGFERGISIPIGPQPKVTINGGTLDNRINVYVLPRDVFNNGGRVAEVNGVTFAPGAEFNLFWEPETFGKWSDRLFDAEVVTLDGTRLYPAQMHADYVPFPTGNPPTGTPPEYVGLTNAELQAQFGVSLGGGVIDSTLVYPGTNTLVESLPEPPQTCEELLEAALERIRELEGN